jgi:hypothetical protein
MNTLILKRIITLKNFNINMRASVLNEWSSYLTLIGKVILLCVCSIVHLLDLIRIGFGFNLHSIFI